jgi:hypothetical protein
LGNEDLEQEVAEEAEKRMCAALFLCSLRVLLFKLACIPTLLRDTM